MCPQNQGKTTGKTDKKILIMVFDLFISHSSEDKDTVVRPLAELLKKQGVKVWYDEFVLKIGDGIMQEIDRGLGSCRFGVVVLSESFFLKEWPRRELDGLAAREIQEGTNLILPVWHEISYARILSFSPLLASRLGVSTQNGLPFVAKEIAKVLRSAPEPSVPQPLKVPLLQSFTIFDAEEKGCPNCSGKVVINSMASESGEFAIGNCEKCGWEDYYP